MRAFTAITHLMGIIVCHIGIAAVQHCSTHLHVCECDNNNHKIDKTILPSTVRNGE